jgi:hypothetical protein
MLNKIYTGCYRLSGPLAWTAFGHIRRDGRLWKAEIRDIETGDMRRPASFWASLKDAEGGCRHLLDRDFRRPRGY